MVGMGKTLVAKSPKTFLTRAPFVEVSRGRRRIRSILKSIPTLWTVDNIWTAQLSIHGIPLTKPPVQTDVIIVSQGKLFDLFLCASSLGNPPELDRTVPTAPMSF